LYAPCTGAAIAAEIEVLAHRQIGEDSPSFRDVNEAARNDCRRLFVHDIGAIEANRAGACTQDARDDTIECRLAYAIRPKHGNDLA
jgi:hypothetical protein